MSKNSGIVNQDVVLPTKSQTDLELGIRKFVESNRVIQWHSIIAKPLEKTGKKKRTENVIEAYNPIKEFMRNFIYTTFWKIFISTTIFINGVITITALAEVMSIFIYLAIFVHINCFFFWIDFIGALVFKNSAKDDDSKKKARNTSTLIVEAISLIPFSAVYLIVQPNPDQTLFWCSRLVTLIRFYRIQYYLKQMATPGRYFWNVYFFSTLLYLTVLINVYCTVFIIWNKYRGFYTDIYGYGDNLNNFIIAIYFTLVTMLNIGYGDIVFVSIGRIWMCTFGMALGFATIRGVLTGVLATKFAHYQKEEAKYRHEQYAILQSFKKFKIDKKTVKRTTENMQLIWDYREGHLSNSPPTKILPESILREISFDINFGILSRTKIFSKQPKSFLRSVSLLMRNLSFLPGEVISEPPDMAHEMLCILSGIVEILTGDNAEIVLFSLTAGSVIGESTIFVSFPKQFWLKASTYVEMQVLPKEKFFRLALKYPEICQSIRTDMMYRLDLPKASDFEREHRYFAELFDILKDTKVYAEKMYDKMLTGEKAPEKYHVRSTFLGLYVASDNIPKIKTLPVSLIRGKPWILRPNTFLTDLWEGIAICCTVIVVYAFPFLAGFVRDISGTTFILIHVVDFIYIFDLYVQCTTAIQRADHFTYYTNLKDIIVIKLKSPGFYVDVLSTLNLTVYAELVSIKNKKYATLLLLQNRILRGWHICAYFQKLEKSWSLNLLLVRFFKYLTYLSIVVLWSGVSLYLEACPEEVCIRERWFSRTEEKEIQNMDPEPLSEWPSLMTLYWSCVTVTGVGYGDIVVAAVPDCVLISFWIVVGSLLLIYIMAEASTTMKNSIRRRSQFQEEVFSVDKFMKEYDISSDTQKRVRNYFQVQWNYDRGYTLKEPQFLKDSLLTHKKVLVTHLAKKYLSVPLFRNTTTEFLKILVKSSKYRILPPNEIVVERGSVGREMFILDEGFCTVTETNDRRIEPSQVISAVNAFGFVEMIMGGPSKLNVRTLTHCKIITLDYYSYLRAVTFFPPIKQMVDEQIEKYYLKKKLTSNELLGLQPRSSEKNFERLWKRNSTINKAIINVYRFQKIMNSDYWEPFQIWGKFRFFKYFMLPFVFSPNSKVIKTWNVLRIGRALLFGTLAPPYLALPHHFSYFFYEILALQIIGYIDMYLMFHVAYYNKDGLLVIHPSKTAISYLKGNFIIDFIIEFPTYTVVKLVVAPSKFLYILNATGLLKIFQIYKFFQACEYLESDILRRSELTKVLKFVPLSLLVTNVVTGLLITFECFSADQKLEEANIGTRKISVQFERSVREHCPTVHDDFSEQVHLSVFKMYLIVFYWVTASMTTSGFGDLSAHNKIAMIITIIIVFLGIFLYGYMFASLTSNMISAYTSVTKYRGRLIYMLKFLKYLKVNNDIRTRIQLHYEYNWMRTEGSKPQTMLAKVHTSLRESLMASIYEDTIKLVQSFEVAEKSILKIVGGYMDSIHFLSGETIVNYNDILEYIYVIHRGVVEVQDENKLKIAIMGKGGMFGNISNKLFALSSVTIVARKNLEILRLETQPFFRALQNASNSESLLNHLTSQTANYVKPLNAEDDMSLLQSITQTATVDTLAYKIVIPSSEVKTIEGPIMFRIKRFISLLKNSVFIPSNEGIMSCVVLPDSVIYNIIANIAFLVSLLSGLLGLFMFFFQDFSSSIIGIGYFFDVLFFFKIPLTFAFSYYDKFGDYVVNKEKIKRRYLNSKHFVFDFASTVPLELFTLAIKGIWSYRVFSILHLNRVIRFYNVYKYFVYKSKTLKANKIQLQLWWVVVCLITMLHFTAGFWYFQACPFDMCQPECWVLERNLTADSKWELYSTSIYFIVALFTTTGFGDISIYTISELMTATILMIFSQFCIVLLAGSMTTVINDQILNVTIYEKVIRELTETFKRLGISKYQMLKCWNYFTSLWLLQTKEIPKFIRTAPYAMKCEVMYAMFGSHLSESFIFATMEQAFLRQLAVAIQRFVYFSGNYIVHQGDIDNTIYFIHKGQVSVLTVHSNLMETIHFLLQDNDMFGTTQGLIAGKSHNFTYRAETTVELLSLKFNDWKHLLKYFPQCETEIYKRLQTLPHLRQTVIPKQKH